MQVGDEVFVVIRDENNVPLVRRGKAHSTPSDGWWTVIGPCNEYHLGFTITVPGSNVHVNYRNAVREAVERCCDSISAALETVQLQVERMRQFVLEE